MTFFPVALSCLAATPLPADAWSVGPDGRSCVQLEESLLKELYAWEVDAAKSVASEGVWARVNPKDARQMVLIFKDEKVCKELLQAMLEGSDAAEPPRALDADAVGRELEAWLAADAAAKADWDKVAKKERQAILKEAAKLFGPGVTKERADAVLAPLVKKETAAQAGGKKLEVEPRARLGLYRRLYVLALGIAFGAGGG
jgi:hypothetical protein